MGSVALSQASVFHTAEAEELNLVLAAVLEPQHPGRLRAALATTLMGGDAAVLEALAQDEVQLSAWHGRFAGWHACWAAQGIAALLRRWQREAQVAGRLLAHGDGARRLVNLRHLGERLHEASAQQASPRALLRWFDLRRRSRAVDEADQLRLESDAPLVRVVTIHKAKGLEYGLVFCPLLWDAQVPPTTHGGLRETRDDQGRPVLDLRGGLDGDEDEAQWRAQRRGEQAAETLRLIYVALTRAVHRCYLVVGAYGTRSGKGISRTAGTRGLLNWLVAGEGFNDPSAWLEQRLSAAEIEAAWRRLAGRCGAIGLSPLPLAPGEPLPAAPPLHCEALAPPRRIAPGWQVVEADALQAPPPAGEPTDAAQGDWGDAPDSAAAFLALPRDDVLRFPRGALAGETLRAALERADFSDPDSWDAAALEALRLKPLPGAGGEARERSLAAMLRRMLQDVSGAELLPGLRLRDLDASRCLRAVEFHLPAPALTAEGLQALASSLGLQAPAPTADAFEEGGCVRGVLDLVFEHEGRWWLLAWRTDVLGTDASGYGGEPLARAARGHALALLCETLALRRWLSRRVAGYRHDAYFGGAIEVFVRGVRPGWRAADGAACGVVRSRVTQDELDRLRGALEG